MAGALYRSRGANGCRGFGGFEKRMLRNIQALRAIAALLVVVVHLEVLGASLGLDRAFFNLFAVGVDLFFVISGFIMVHTTSRRTISPGAFVLNRIVRIAPLYWVLTLAVFALALVVPSMLGTTQADWGALLRSLAFIPYERADGSMRPVLFVGWSFNLEMAFYLVFAVALVMADIGKRVALGVAVLAASVVLHFVAGDSLPATLRFLTQPILLEFAVGMVIGWLYPYLPTSRLAGRAAAVIGVLALVALVAAAQWPLPDGLPVSLPPACVVVLAALVAERSGLGITWRPIQSLGDASYALYLTHPFVTQAWTLAVHKGGLLSPLTAPALMMAATVSAAAAGIVVHRQLERPLGHLAQKGVARLLAWRTSIPSPRQPRADRWRTLK